MCPAEDTEVATWIYFLSLSSSSPLKGPEMADIAQRQTEYSVGSG